ncbi:MAG TPA: SDR family NAD(P)-dependent oxidoreductase [Streptosporangiaceae bacterium]|jgi:short-subunit dehydrogenase
MRLSGAVALITGGSSGVGAATACALASAGAKPLIAGRDMARLTKVAARSGGLALTADLATPDGPACLAAAAEQAAGPVDLLVNNAGVGWAGPIGEMPKGAADELIAVNLTAAVELSRLLIPGMRRRARGRVVFVSSIVGSTGVRGEAVYAAAKAGLNGFAESLSYELDGSGVGVSIVVPGVIDTPFFDRRGRPYQRRRPLPIHPERVARAIISAAERDRAVVFVPRWTQIPVWLHGAAPAAFRALANRFG